MSCGWTLLKRASKEKLCLRVFMNDKWTWDLGSIRTWGWTSGIKQGRRKLSYSVFFFNFIFSGLDRNLRGKEWQQLKQLFPQCANITSVGSESWTEQIVYSQRWNWKGSLRSACTKTLVPCQASLHMGYEVKQIRIIIRSSEQQLSHQPVSVTQF